MKRLSLIWLFCCFIAYLLFCDRVSGQHQNIKFDRITSDNTITVKGLSQNSIFCILQDSKGFIWIGTWDGLNKYDGYDFIIFNTANGLSNPTINALMEDNNQNIWVGTEDGLNMRERETGKIRQYHKIRGQYNCLSNDFINHIFQSKSGLIWISTAYGLNSYNKEQDIFTTYNFFERIADSSFTNFITKVQEDQSGMIWISTHRGIHSFDPVKQSFKDYRLEEDITSSDFRRSNYVQDFVIGDNGLIYAATLNGVFIIRPGSGTIQHLKVEKGKLNSLSGLQVNALLVDLNGLLWIGTNQGLDLYDPVLDQVTSYKSGGKITNLSHEDIRCIFQDNSGTMWIGTYKGLNKADRSPSRFLHYRNDPDNPNSLNDNIVYAFFESTDRVAWVGTYDGINLLDRKNERFSFIRHDENDPGSITGNRIRTIVLDSTGHMWVGTENRGMNKIDPATGKVSRYRYDSSDLTTIPEDNILSTYVDRKGRIWIGTVSKGIGILDPVTGKMDYLSANKESRLQLSDNKIWSVYEDKAGDFWICTNHGLNKIVKDFKSIEVFYHDPSDQNTLSSDRLFSIYEDSEGIYWIGTMGGGMNRFDPNTSIFKTYNEINGLPNNVVYGILEDGDGNLWLSTNWGLSKFIRQNEIFVNYDTKDGVQGNEFNAGAFLKNHLDEMYFGGMNGFNVFHPNEITLNKVPPTLVFTGLRILNALKNSDIDDGEVIRLRYDENFFSIEFSALDYTNPSKNLYRYMLGNYDNEWIMANAGQRRAEYRKVDPGTYVFRVIGSNNDGVWNTDGISLTIIIHPPWWKSWIFRSFFIIFLVLSIWGIILARIKTIRRKHEVEKKMLSIEKQVFELEQKALRLQMNPHFMFNSLNAIQNFVLASDTDKAVNYLARFSHLMRMILANSTASLITLRDELKALTYYIELEKLRFDDKFDYEIIRDPSVDEEFVEIPPMLFQPYVENAIIHGLVNSPNRGHLEIIIKQIGKGTLRCQVKDNGIGREKAIEIRNQSGIKRQPKGMVITQERIEVFNRQYRKNFSVRITDLKDERGDPAGTLVEFTIHYKEI